MDEQTKKRNWNVPIPPREREEFKILAIRMGWTIQVTAGRILRWFLSLTPEEQAIVLGQIRGEFKTSLARAILSVEGTEAEKLFLTRLSAPQPSRPARRAGRGPSRESQSGGA